MDLLLGLDALDQGQLELETEFNKGQEKTRKQLEGGSRGCKFNEDSDRF